MEVFEYPLREELFQLVQNKGQLKELLKKEGTHLGINKQYFKITIQANRYIYARCRRCQSNLKYKRREDGFALKSFNCIHRHEHKRRSSQIEEFIKGMPLTMTPQSLMQITTKTFSISRDKFYYHNRKLWFEKADFSEILKDLDKNNNQTRLVPFPLPQDQFPDIFLTASQKMISQFRQFGEKQFVTFDITYNLIKEVKIEDSENGQIKRKKWGVGLFLGKNNHNKAIPYCICILNSETKDSFFGVFKSFLEMMNGEPQVFITDEQTAIESAIRQLKEEGQYNGYHVLDTFHILRNINKKTNNSKLAAKLRDAMFAKYEDQYKKILQESRELCRERQQLSIYNRFISNEQKYCFSKTPQCFHGISISTSFGEKVNDFIKDYIPHEYPFKVVVRKLLKSVDLLAEKSQEYKLMKIHYEDLFPWKQLKLLRFTLCETLFKSFLQNYIESLSLNVNQLDDNIWEINGYQLTVESSKFICSCGYFQKCGLPCSHLIKVIVITHQDVQNYIHNRWKVVQKANLNHSIMIPRGQPRHSRRQ